MLQKSRRLVGYNLLLLAQALRAARLDARGSRRRVDRDDARAGVDQCPARRHAAGCRRGRWRWMDGRRFDKGDGLGSKILKGRPARWKRNSFTNLSSAGRGRRLFFQSRGLRRRRRGRRPTTVKARAQGRRRTRRMRPTPGRGGRRKFRRPALRPRPRVAYDARRARSPQARQRRGHWSQLRG